ncbi:MAG TPA: LTA synthase family protein, partial [Ferruginibacter sp.]|nr:LTA synthase family protein [Ferruginibacter sp.]
NLRWSDAFTLSDDFKANLALNPLQSFFSSLKFRHSTYDINKVKSAWPLMADYLGIENKPGSELLFERDIKYPDTASGKPNVVLVICESFSMYKSSMAGNPLNTTPYFNELCNKGVFFERCFTPAYGTARGVWAAITGIPDVEMPRTASRNPAAVNQHTIINDFKGYTPFYFLGGNPTWANIQGLLSNNISGLKLYQQDNFNAKKIDVWGISDKNLLLEANGILKNHPGNFFAIIQTADNHRPYTIPDEDKARFKLMDYPSDSLHRYGFENNDELNAFRYTDFCFEQFMEAAKKEKYFNNTIFVFVGDHGIRGNAGDMLPEAYTKEGLVCEHVPLLFYAPSMLAPKRSDRISSQVDILPSIASLAKVSYRNTTLGRNLFDSSSQQEHLAFIIDHDVKSIGMVSGSYYYLRNLESAKEEFVSIKRNEDARTPKADTARKYLSAMTSAWFETAKYLLLNNKKKN